MAELNTEQWAQVKQLFERASLLGPEEGRAFLERECGDAEVRGEVASLLEHAGGLPTAAQAIASMAAVTTEEDPDQRLIGARLGPYRVEAIAGHGGMGAVYRAERDDAEFRQRVAIKLVRVAAASPGALSRFKQERQILARLSHPNIARLLDGGSTPEGVPYLVMEYIEGEPVTVWCERQVLKLEDRLRLFVQVCEGVEHAHRRLIVHRDLKPANILVTPDGTPKLLDFGIAKLLDASADAEAVTKTGLHPMTPEYASPEQVRGEPVTPAADVYALGLILYELLTGKKAQPVPDCSPAALAQVVCMNEPPVPASVLPELAGDLDSIIRVALRKEAERRYRSGGELGRDIQRHLDKLPVTARPDTLAYRSTKFVRRNRVMVAAGVLVAASLAGGFALSLAARHGAEKRLPRVLRVDQLTQIGSVETTFGVVSDGTRVYFTVRKGGSWSIAQIPVEGGTPQPLPAAQTLGRPVILNISPDHSSLLVAASLGVSNDEPLWIVPTAGGAPRRMGDLLAHGGAWSRDGRTIVFLRACSFYRVNNHGTDLRKLFDVPCFPDVVRSTPAAGPDLLRFNIVNPNMKSIALWEASADGRGLHPLLRDWHNGGFPDGERVGAWTPSGNYYLFQSVRQNVSSIWALREAGGLLPSFDRSPVQIYSTPMDFESLAVNPDGKRIFIGAGQERRELMRYDRKLRQFLPFLSGVGARWASYSRDGNWVAYVAYPEATLWRSRPDGSEARQLTPASLRVTSVPRWSPDGTRIAFGGWLNGQPPMAYVVSPVGGKPEAIPSTAYIEGSPSWSPDGKSLAFGCLPYAYAPANWGVYIMDWATRKARFLPGPENDHMEQPVWSPDGRYLAAHRLRSKLMLFDLRNERWSHLADAVSMTIINWSQNSEYVYYQDYYGGPDQPIFRVNVRSRQGQPMMGLQQIPQSNVTGFLFGGMAPGDAPIASVIRYNSDIYSLEVELP